MVNTKTLMTPFGLSTNFPNALSLQVTFTESAVNAGAGTSTVTAKVQIYNTVEGGYARKYTSTDAHVSVTVGAVNRQVTGTQAEFNLKSGERVTLATLTFTGVNHRRGPVFISTNGLWPTGTAGQGGAPEVTSFLALTYASAPPTPPVWTTIPAVPTGTGTQVRLTWVNMEDKTPAGVTQISPYTALTLLVSQGTYPSQFTPNIAASDLGSIAGGKLALSNYAVKVYWFINPGPEPTLASAPVTKTNVAANHVLTVKPPSNPPASAVGWGLAVARAEHVAAVADSATIQTFATTGTPQGSLSTTWVSPATGPTTTGGTLKISAVDQAALNWGTSASVPLAGPPWPTTTTYPTTGGFWYRFTLAAFNNAAPPIVSAGVSGTPVIYYCTGQAPNTGGSDSGSAGEGPIFAPAANIGVVAQASNSFNASASVIPTAAELINFSANAQTIPTIEGAIVSYNYCGDPRAYWPYANSAGNNSASPYVIEANTAGFTAHNAQVPPSQMSYALAALGLASVDRAHTLKFLGANNNTGSAVSSYVYVGGNPDTPNAAASFVLPVSASTVQLSAMAWVNSANNVLGRAVTPFSGIRFNALYANGVSVAGENTVALSPIPVNALVPLSASYTLPAGANSVVAALVANTAAGANWSGGLQGGDSVSVTAFMLGLDQTPGLPYFDGGWPNVRDYSVLSGGDLATTNLNQISGALDGNIPGLS